MRHPWTVLALALCLTVTLSLTTEGPPSLTSRIDDLIQRPTVDDAFWGVAIYDLDAERMLYSHNADRAFLPASTLKVVTSAAALNFLGGTHRYETTLYYDGSPSGDVMRGDLLLEGSGDPTFGSSEVRGEDPLRAWAERLADMGVEHIEGRLIGDATAFDDRPYPEGWTIDYITDQKGRHVGNSAGGLTYRDNVVPVDVRATDPGSPPSVTAQPENVVSIENKAVTSARWRGNTLQVTRTFSTNELVLTGSVGRSYNGTVAVPVSNPTMFVLRSFEKRLQESGITTDLELLTVDEVDRAPDRGSPLFVEFSRPLAEIVAEMNKNSNNFYAEQVFRTYGWEGSARGGARRTTSFLQQAGVNTRQVSVHDGSGLSRKDLLTPQALTQVLTHMNEHEEREAFLSSLPRGGERNTTLKYRLHRTDVQAKTGSLEFVRTLTGYATRPNGNRVAFALLANNFTGPSYQISRTIDDIVRAVASSS